MIAITVSTNYADLLDIIIPINCHYFEKWLIVTHSTDIETIKVIKKHQRPNISIIYFDFYKNVAFNKGGAIKYCQDYILRNVDYSGPILLLDSDICLPDNFNELIASISFRDGTIYGTEKRLDYYSLENFKNNVVDYDYPWSQDFQGYFQLYLHNPAYLYNDSYNCSNCDLEFLNYFQDKVIIPNMVVKHLGKSGVHWNKRLDKTDFIQ